MSMSIFMRQCLIRHQCPFQTAQALHFFIPRASSQSSRCLSTTQMLRAAKKPLPKLSTKASLPKGKPSYTPGKASASSPAAHTYQTYASTLAQKSQPTLLYQAPSHTTFMACCYGAGLFCFTYAGISFYSNYLTPPEDLSTWVPIAFGVISFFMACTGTYLVLGPARLIRRIAAIPRQAATSGSTSAAVVKAVHPELQIEVELRKMFPLPFFPARKIYAKPEEFVLRHSLVAPVSTKLTPEQLRAIRIEEEVIRQRELEYERSHIMSAPFRHFSRAMYSVFKNTGRSWTREGFVKVRVKDGVYKLDISGGWALDKGKAIDRLAVIKPY